MFGRRTVIGVGCSALLLGVTLGCGGAVEKDGPESTAGRSSHGGKSSGEAGAAATSGSFGRAGSGASAGSETLPDGGLIDPPPVVSGCPAQDLPPPDLACDPFTPGGCGHGAGCYPFVDHPQGSGCDEQHYGTVCLPAGHAAQGMMCGEDGGDWCAPGLVCVVGQRAGKRCAALCKLGVANQCTGGLICGDLDVAGFGVCG